MKIGILTYHGAHNYGSALQAYALHNYLTNLGHKVDIINFRSDRQDKLYQIYTKPNSIMAVLRNLQSFAYRKQLVEHHNRFNTFLADNATLSGAEMRNKESLLALNGIYDCFICGSDQIWNPNCIDFDSSYLLDFVADKRICIAYAPSIASDTLSEEWYEIFKKELGDFSSLSVREDPGAKIIETITQRSVVTTVDPVFLLSKDQWDTFSTEENRGYILCYFIGDIPGMREYAVTLGRKCQKPIVVINKNLRDWKMQCQKKYETGPKEFVGLIRNADAVCTNSFHAVAFSLIFEKEFHVFVDNMHANTARSRIIGLLGMLDLCDRIVGEDRKILISDENDVSRYQDKLKMHIQDSKQYLGNAIRKVEEYRLKR